MTSVLRFLSPRLGVTLLAVLLAMPVGCATGCVLLDRNVTCMVGGGCHDLTLTYVILLVLGAGCVHAAASWVAERVKAWRSTRIPLVAIGAVGGMMIGVTSFDARPVAAAFGLATAGAFVGALFTVRKAAIDTSFGEDAAEE